MIINIEVNNQKVATLIKNIKTEERINFFTQDDDQLQVAAFKMMKNEKCHFSQNYEKTLRQWPDLIKIRMYVKCLY